MKNLLPLMLCGLIAVTTAACTNGGTEDVVPDYLPTPAALSFEACPTKDEGGQAVQDVYPDTQKVLIENRARIAGGLKLSLTGADAAAFKLADNLPTTIERLGSVEVPIAFSPAKKGDLRAELVIDDETEGTENQIVTLVGTGKNLPAQATLETAPQKTDKSGFLSCTANSILTDCTLEFPDTLMDQANTLQLKIRNRGCPALKVTGLNIESFEGDTQGFSIDTPAVLPSSGSPMLLSSADGTEEVTVTVRFTAADDGLNGNEQLRSASLVILSNDPTVGDGFAQPARISLLAKAVKPSIYATPGSCNFSNEFDACGNTPRVPNSASFRITNDGSTALTLSRVAFRSSGGTSSANARFTITQNVQGQTLQPNQSATLVVTHADMPIFVMDQIDVEATLAGGGSGGMVSLAVSGGLKPCMTTEPLDQITFMDSTQEVSAQNFRIKNGASCGTLIVNEVSIAQNPFFSLIDPLIPPGTQVAPGQFTETTVQYRRPPSGGMQLGELVVKTNDSDYGPPQYKIVQLYSSTPLDALPVAALTACGPAELVNDPDCALGKSTSGSFNLSMIDPDEITLSGKNSTDDTMVKEYAFTLLPPLPANVTTAALANNGVRGTASKTKLTIPTGATGTYRIRLEVWDNRGQKSGNTSMLTLSIYP